MHAHFVWWEECRGDGGGLFEFGGFFVGLNFATNVTILFKSKLVGGVYLIALGKVIE